MSDNELYEFIQYFTFRFYGQEFKDRKMFNFCLLDWKQEQWRASHSDLWPEKIIKERKSDGDKL